MVEETENNRAVISQPAGHLEKGESLLAAVAREVQEETGWRFTPEALTGIYRWEHSAKGITYLRFCFTGAVHSHDPHQTLDAGILRTHWLTREQMQASRLRSPVVWRCVEDYLAGHRYPLSLYTDISNAELLAARGARP
jgi:8-oxo-dGTP pyrophosphatase MutT (NUDIX family)